MAVNVTSGGKARVDQVVSVLAPAFENDPVFNYFLCNHDKEKRKRLLPYLQRVLVNASALNQAQIIEAAGWGSCAVLLAPGKKPDNPLTLLPAGLLPAGAKLGMPTAKRLLFKYDGAVGPVKAKELSKKEAKGFWYIIIMATALDRRRQGLAKALLEYIQKVVRDDGRPLWLEATTPASRDLYAGCGFKVVDEVVLGKGEVGVDGLSEGEGREGITLWAMVWRP